MPDEPNKKMDEMLRSYAEERRKAPETPLHQATRNMLQGEVARVFRPGKNRKSWIEYFRSFWPQIAFGGSLCVILGIAIVSLRQPPRELKREEGQQLTAPSGVSSETIPDSTEPAEAPPTPKLNTFLQRASEPELQKELREAGTSTTSAPKPSQKRVALRDEKVVVEALAEDNVAVLSAPTPSLAQAGAQPQGLDAAAVIPAPNPAAKQESLFRANREATVQTAPAQASSPTRPSLDATTRNSRSSAAQQSELYSKARLNESVTNLGAARRLHFVQQHATEPTVRAQTISASGARPILQSFEVEQLGREVRVLDWDGSVYSGILDPQPAAALITAKDESFRYGTAAAAPTNAAVFNLSLQGTNKTLGAGVTLTGLFYEKTNEPRSSLDSFSIRTTAQKSIQGAASAPSHMIIGNAVVGATNQFNFRAVSLEKP